MSSNLVRLFPILLTIQSVLTSAIPDDWPPASTFQIATSSDTNGPTVTSAYINVTHFLDGQWSWEQDEFGKFGSGYIGPAKGVLVHVASKERPHDHTGCSSPLSSTRPDGSLPLPGEQWIALIKRGRCNFESKVENAYNSGAIGVIVYNDRESVNLDKMRLSSESGRNISAVFTYKWKGEQLASYIQNDTEVWVSISVGKTEPIRATAINRTSVLFVSTTFIVLMIISLAWLIFYYVQRFRHIHAKDKLSKRLSNAAKKALSKIPTKSIKVDDKEVKEGECCAVCIEPYKTSEVLRILPCSHEFHKGCIDPWLLEHRTCPMCKMDILKHYGFVFSGSQESILVAVDNDDTASLDAREDPTTRRTGNGVSPLPQIRAEILSQQDSDDSSNEDNCSWSSNQYKLAPSQSSTSKYPLSSQYCINCRGPTTVANVLVSSSDSSDTCAIPDGANNQESRDEQTQNKRQISS